MAKQVLCDKCGCPPNYCQCASPSFTTRPAETLDHAALRRDCELHAPYRTMPIAAVDVLALLDEIATVRGERLAAEAKRDEYANKWAAACVRAHNLERERDAARAKLDMITRQALESTGELDRENAALRARVAAAEEVVVQAKAVLAQNLGRVMEGWHTLKVAIWAFEATAPPEGPRRP